MRRRWCKAELVTDLVTELVTPPLNPPADLSPVTRVGDTGPVPTLWPFGPGRPRKIGPAQ
jgi:hypothetical protein